MDEPVSNQDPFESLVFLEYTILFDPEETWAYLSDFEQDLSDFFAAYGLEARIIKTANDSPSKRVMFIKKSEVLERPILPEEVQTGPAQTMKTLLDSKRQKRNPLGQFRGVNK